MNQHLPTTAVADRIAAALTTPTPLRSRWHRQSLAHGPPGTALLHIERAYTGTGTWSTAHRWLTQAVRPGITTSPESGLYTGAPAVAFALHTTTADHSGRYRTAIAAIDAAVTTLTHLRVDRGEARITAGRRPALAEYDLIRGLTGLGAHMLRHAPGDHALGRLLNYLVRLTRPVHHDGETLPGWWTHQSPHGATSPQFPGGHANAGLAHGIAGPLALLGLALRHGVTVEGQREAIERIIAWLDAWQQPSDAGVWWPQWITEEEQRRGRIDQPGPGQPSWCYGTPGIARAQQLAAIATGDTTRQRHAEQALTACLADPAQLNRITGNGLCHGWAGLFQTMWHAAADAAAPTLANHLPHLADRLLQHAEPAANPGADPRLLEGHAGLALTLHTAASHRRPISGWDRCLLLA
jgi:membrane-associated phospholipid phosphatase